MDTETISFFVVATALLPFVVQALKKFRRIAKFDSRHIAMAVAGFTGLVYATISTYAPEAFITHLALFTTLSWSIATALYRQYNK